MTDSSYLAIILLMIVGGLVASVMVIGSWFLGPRRPTPQKLAPYECGVTPVASARERFPVKFYLIAMLFIIFDIESIFLFAWYPVFNNPRAFPDHETWKRFQTFTYFEVSVFMIFLVIGLVYVFQKGALRWEEPSESRPVSEEKRMTTEPFDWDDPMPSTRRRGAGREA